MRKITPEQAGTVDVKTHGPTDVDATARKAASKAATGSKSKAPRGNTSALSPEDDRTTPAGTQGPTKRTLKPNAKAAGKRGVNRALALLGVRPADHGLSVAAVGSKHRATLALDDGVTLARIFDVAYDEDADTITVGRTAEQARDAAPLGSREEIDDALRDWAVEPVREALKAVTFGG